MTNDDFVRMLLKMIVALQCIVVIGIIANGIVLSTQLSLAPKDVLVEVVTLQEKIHSNSQKLDDLARRMTELETLTLTKGN